MASGERTWVSDGSKHYGHKDSQVPSPHVLFTVSRMALSLSYLEAAG